METSLQMMEAMLPFIPLHGKLLDPSCGTGLLMEYINRHCGNSVDGIELNQSKFIEAIERPSNKGNIIQGDFLSDRIAMKLRGRRYDGIIAVPPYKDGIDCAHIIRMFGTVMPGGVVISYTLPIWVTGTFTHQIEFREWLNQKTYEIKFIEDESYASCPKALLVIRK